MPSQLPNTHFQPRRVKSPPFGTARFPHKRFLGRLSSMFDTDSWTARHSALFTDQCELTMAASYSAERMLAPATFSFFVHKHSHGGEEPRQ